MNKLRSQGIDVYMMSGDNEESADIGPRKQE